MGNRSSNIGETGVKSIRLKGQRIEDMPIGTGNEALSQLDLARETERLNQIATINAEYPSQRVDWLASRINEAEKNKQRMNKLRTDTLERIQQYEGLIIQCDVRDKLLAEIEVNEKLTDEQKQRRKDIFKQWGRWDADALRQQVEQDKEALVRLEDVIKQEDESIKQVSETIALCRERDRKLAALGAKAEGS